MWAVIGLEGIAVAFFLRGKLLQLALLLIVPFALILPWLAFVFQTVQRRSGPRVPWAPSAGLGVTDYIQFFSDQMLIVSSKFQPAAAALLVSAGFLMVLVCFRGVSKLSPGSPGKLSLDRVVFCLYFGIAVAPVTIAFLVKTYAFALLPIGMPYFVCSVVCYLLLVGRGITMVSERFRHGAVTCVLLLGVAQCGRDIVKISTHSGTDWQRAAVALAQRADECTPPCQIYALSATYSLPLGYYLRHMKARPGEVALMNSWNDVSSSHFWVVGSQKGLAGVLGSGAVRGYKVSAIKSIDSEQRVWAASLSR